MALVLRINSIPGYIQDGEFKNVFAQLAECLSCNLVKGVGPGGELVGYVRFASPNAANRAMQMYQGWQGFGNTDGLRIVPVTEEPGPGVKRGREDAGREDAAFKQSRVMGAGNMAYSTGGAQFPGFQQDGSRSGDIYNQMQPNTVTGNQPGNAGAFVSSAQAHPQYGRQTGGQQEFQGGASSNVDPRLQAAGTATGSRPMTQNYYPTNNAPRDSPMPIGSQAPAAGAQNVYGSSTGIQQVPSQNMPQQSLQPQHYQQPQGGNQQGAPQMNPPYNMQQQPPPIQQPGNFTSYNGPTSNDAYDPQKPQLDGLQQLGNQLQQQNPQNNSTASLAAIQLLLQQGGLQGLQGILNQNAPAQQPNAAPAPQMNVMDQRPPGQVQSQIPPGNIQMAARPQTLPTPQPQPFQPPMDVLPHDAAPTLYVDGMALDVSKREMSHIFRPFEGFKEMRMVEKKDKNGKPLLIAFAEFETPHQAAASMKVLQDYPLDMSTPMENKLRLSYAKPLKSSDPRSRGQTAAGRPFAAPGGGGDQFRGPGRDRGQGNQDARRGGGDRRDRDRGDRRGNRDDRVRTGGGDRKKQ